ncbi:MAG: sugar phosphate isomerase/epimerase [Desulforhopalus sp.]|jgi:sugar phosphate isomerase/epimerase
MKLGLETESYHLWFQHGRMEIIGFIERVAELGLDGVQINLVKHYNQNDWGVLGSIDSSHLKRVRQAIEYYNFFVELDTITTDSKHLRDVLNVASCIGADRIRTCIRHPGIFSPAACDTTVKDIKSVLPDLESKRITLSLENHEEETADEILDMISQINSPWVGVHCDIGNPMMAWEDPVEAVKKLAPHTFTTHFKDHIVIPHGDEFYVCGVPLGDGNINLDECFNHLVHNSSLTRIVHEMCYPYCSPFRRAPGTGGVHSLGSGAFSIESPLYTDLAPDHYYHPHEVSNELLEELIDSQDKGVKKGVAVLKALRDKHSR